MYVAQNNFLVYQGRDRLCVARAWTSDTPADQLSSPTEVCCCGPAEGQYFVCCCRKEYSPIYTLFYFIK